jgi:hypothetical protein
MEREDYISKSLVKRLLPAQDIDDIVARLLIDRFPGVSIALSSQRYHVKLNGESSSCLNTVFFRFSSDLTVVDCFVVVEVIASSIARGAFPPPFHHRFFQGQRVPGTQP